MAVRVTKGGLQSYKPSVKVGAGGGVYEASTGTYTDVSGQKFSTRTAPSGSISLGGGGGGGISSAPSVSIPTTAAISVVSVPTPELLASTSKEGAAYKPFAKSYEEARKPSGTLSYGENIKKYGLFSGTIESAGIAAMGLVKEQKLGILSDYLPYEARGTYRPLSPEEEARRVGIKTGIAKSGAYAVATSLPYFIPHVAAPLLLATGVESYAYKGGRERIKEQAEIFKGWGLGEGISKGAAWSLPALKIGVGAFGTIKGAKQFIASRELRQLEQTPMKMTGYRLETEEGGLDVLYGYKKAGKTGYFSAVRQPFYRVGGEKIVFEEGKGVGMLFRKSNLKIVGFESAGREYAGGMASFVKKDIYGITKTALPELETGFGRMKITEIFTGKFKFTSGIQFPSGKLFDRVQGKIFPSDKIISKSFLGSAKREENIIGLIGTKAETLKYYPSLGKFTARGGLTQYGRIKVISAGDFGGDIVSLGRTYGMARTTGTYAKEILGTSLKTLTAAPKLGAFSKSVNAAMGVTTAKGLGFGVSQRQMQVEKLYPTYAGGTSINEGIKEMQRNMQSVIQLQLPSERIRETTMQLPRMITIPRTRQLSGLGLVSGEIESEVAKQIQIQIPKTISGVPSPLIPEFTIPKGMGWGGFYFPPLLFSEGKKGYIGGKRGYAYQPSLAALGFGITAPSIPRGTWTGLVLRPIISGKRRKPARRKKSQTYRRRSVSYRRRAAAKRSPYRRRRK